jgi:aspartyl-tRNA(Asn)/glutamyl-tRNA(Gln) amidotransferase subunit B
VNRRDNDVYFVPRIIHELVGQLTFRNRTFTQNSVSAQQLGDIIDAVERGTITRTGGKIILRHLLDAEYSSSRSIPSTIPETMIPTDTPILPEKSSAAGHPSVPTLIRELNLLKSSSEQELNDWCNEAIQDLPNEAEKVRLGKKNVLMVLVGRVMKLSRGSADAASVRDLLEKKLDPKIRDSSNQ